MAKEKLTFDDAKAIIVKNLPEDFFSGPNGEKHKEALSLMSVAFERAKCTNLREFCNKVRKEFAEKLKDVFTTVDGTFECCEVEEHIDNLIKEMEEK